MTIFDGNAAHDLSQHDENHLLSIVKDVVKDKPPAHKARKAFHKTFHTHHNVYYHSHHNKKDHLAGLNNALENSHKLADTFRNNAHPASLEVQSELVAITLGSMLGSIEYSIKHGINIDFMLQQKVTIVLLNLDKTPIGHEVRKIFYNRLKKIHSDRTLLGKLTHKYGSYSLHNVEDLIEISQKRRPMRRPIR